MKNKNCPKLTLIGQAEKAISYYKQAINVDAGFRIGYKNISVAYNDLGSQCFSSDKNVEQAIRYFKKALKYNIDLNDAYYNLGVVYSSKGSREEAIRYYKYCVEVCPDYINVCISSDYLSSFFHSLF